MKDKRKSKHSKDALNMIFTRADIARYCNNLTTAKKMVAENKVFVSSRLSFNELMHILTGKDCYITRKQ